MRPNNSINGVIILFLLLFYSCIGDCSYTIKLNYIESNCNFKEGFLFQEIEALSFDNQGLPDSIIVLSSYDLRMESANVEPLGKIFFDRENKGYTWYAWLDTKRNCAASYSKILPIMIEPCKWYKIRGLIFLGHPDRAAYLHLGQDGKFEVHGYNESTNW